MLHRQLSEHAAGCFYSDEQVAKHLWQFLHSSQDDTFNDIWQLLQNECYQLLTSSVDTRYPREFRLNDIRALMGQQCHAGLFVSSHLPWLDELADTLLIRNGDYLQFRESKTQAYVRLAAELDPSLLVGWQLADWLQQNPIPQIHDIRRVINAQLPFFAPPANSAKPFAEGHVHVWGVTTESLIFNEILFQSKPLKNGNAVLANGQLSDAQTDELLVRARTLFADLISFAKTANCSPDKQLKSEQANSFSHWLKERDASFRTSNDWELIAKLPHNINELNLQWLLVEFAKAICQRQANCWLWLHVFLSFIYQSSSTFESTRVAILCFWQTMNALRRRLIMDGQGLSRFVETYNGSYLRKVGQPYQDNIRRIFAGKGDVAEIKSGLFSFTEKSIENFSQALLSSSNVTIPKAPYIFGEHEVVLNEGTRRYIDSLERWHYCGHFSRSQLAGIGKRPKADLKENWKKAAKLLRKLNSQSGWSESTFLGGKLNPSFHFQPNRWFRGLDVAGDENALKIEYFAPMLRWLRSGLHSKSATETACKDFHFSIHAGEDYAHPLSGMRHIDETVRFCDMREGDRLGHALALGIEPAKWAQRQGEMVLYADEHLDNLVWMWHYATVLSTQLPLAQQVIPLLERRIVRFYNKVSWLKQPKFHDEVESQSEAHLFDAQKDKLTPDILYRAWLLRRNCYFQLKKLHGNKPMSAMEVIALPDWARLCDDEKYASIIYKSRHSSLLSDEADAMVIVRVANEWEAQNNIGLPSSRSQLGRNQNKKIIEDIDTPAELEFMAAIQDYLLTQYDSLGIIIETNPTSNVYIARLNSHKEHPIFRWNPPDESVLMNGNMFNRFGLRKGPVKVLVNTDDPGIMPTTLRTEYMLLREAAVEQGIGSTVAERWLESIRQFGLEQFHRNHLPVFEPI
ncbi:antiviral RADAR system adenosine deaminase RdrB [Pseudoalteromonas rubra]|uniref:Adenosine deaminase n=1 Tax=Pseudoalteromonas rubra TaxID=43658 RepID=A0A0U3GJ35_9GAMM|nr:antiviral RADAR system adenosine deaminase RdrB [Pseudoalteromonas rubra]ALU44890.1 hypothetical protein AT705_19195 [Pseudoalteromonas rubra]